MTSKTSPKMGRPAIPVAERFWPKVEKSAGCWNWTAGRIESGYGWIHLEGKKALAHRVSYELAHGPIPEGLFVDHACHNRACVNPSHLRLATMKQNMENRAGANKGNATGVRGVSLNNSGKKYVAGLCHNGERMYLGSYETIAEAAEVVEAKRRELYTHHALAAQVAA
ncbi:HNH endonuclease [Arthrobacter frigidicola]|nr:HNH endonuclease [Arthrobacter frigidicola]